MASILSGGEWKLICHNISTDASARSAKPKEKMIGVLVVTLMTLSSWIHDKSARKDNELRQDDNYNCRIVKRKER